MRHACSYIIIRQQLPHFSYHHWILSTRSLSRILPLTDCCGEEVRISRLSVADIASSLHPHEGSLRERRRSDGRIIRPASYCLDRRLTMDLEKGANDNADLAKLPDRRESIESFNINSHEDAETSIARRKPKDANFLTPIHTTRSRSSVRSQRSYAGADGYTHFEHDDQHDSSLPQSEDNEKIGTPTTDENDLKAFEVRWDGPEDPMNPKSAAWAPYWRKWTIVILGSVSSMCVTFASALYTSAYGGMEREFGVSRLAATVGLSIFVCGLGLGPMFLSPLSEFYGRRPIYLCAFGMYFIWLIPCALANNLATMLVSRFLDGLAGSAFLSVAGGTVGDTFPKEKLSMPMMIYSAAPFCGPLLGPVVGNFIATYKSWRWCFYVLMMWAGVNWLLLFFFVPETYAPVLLRRKARQLRKETGDDRWKAPIEMMNKSVTKTVMWSCIRPFQLLTLEVRRWRAHDSPNP
jgi:multidrug resistance protein